MEFPRIDSPGEGHSAPLSTSLNITVALPLRHRFGCHQKSGVMTDRDPKTAPNRDRSSTGESLNDEIIPGRHGKHGGSLESEGAPQEQSPESKEQPKYNGGDKSRL